MSFSSSPSITTKIVDRVAVATQNGRPHRTLERKRHIQGDTICQKPSCGALTFYQKKYCIDHIENMPYVAKIVETEAASEKEVQRALETSWKSIKPQKSIRCQEMLDVIRRHGEITIEHLARLMATEEFPFGVESVNVYMQSLFHSRLAKVVKRRSRRGSWLRIAMPISAAEHAIWQKRRQTVKAAKAKRMLKDKVFKQAFQQVLREVAEKDGF